PGATPRARRGDVPGSRRSRIARGVPCAGSLQLSILDCRIGKPGLARFASCVTAIGKNSGAAVVGGGDEGASAGRVCGSEHGGCDFFRSAKRDGADGGTGTAETSAERAGDVGGVDHVVEYR